MVAKIILSAARVGHPKSWFRTSMPRHHHAAALAEE
jgi:hypothetical protein